MGADLVGYLLVGPAKITNAMIEKAAKALLKEDKELSAKKVVRCPQCGEENDCAEVEDEDVSCVACCHVFKGSDECGYVESLDEARTVVEKLVEGWPGSLGRDQMFREMPGDPKKVIVAAGDMTWGDEPDGAAYQALKVLYAKPAVMKALGIE